MSSPATNPRIDAFLNRQTTWRPEMEALREIALSCGLTEEMKWGKPCYTDGGSNIVLIQGFKAYCGLLFFKGYMLDDPEGILSDVGPNSRIGKQARFTDLAQIRERSAAAKACIEQAIAVERSGAAAELEQNDLPVPEEFQQKLDEDPALRAAFEALTPGRQREYLLYFSGAKQAKTRAARVEKFIPHILDGLGMRDA